MNNFDFKVFTSNGSGKDGKFKIENKNLYKIPATANVIYLRNGTAAFGISTALKRLEFRSKKGMFVKIPLTLPAVGKPGYVSFEYEKTNDGHKYEWKWHHPATKRIINI